tara:strand:+ start:8206 stop:9198 length:993 start_codon:yes stop_codon:yes gene_type:complete
LKNTNSYKFIDIKKFLSNYSIKIISKIPDNDLILGINSLDNAKKNDLTFFNDLKLKTNLKKSNAKGCFIENKNLKYLNNNCYPIIVDDPYNAFACVTNLLKTKIVSNATISKNSFIENQTVLMNNIQIDSFTNVYADTKIEDNVIIKSNCSIGPNVVIKKNSFIDSNVVLSNCIIGENCIIKSGCVIGGKGFGFDPKTKIQIEHFGNVVIEDNCSIGSNTTIDRAVFDSTIIQSNSQLDNLIQIAHNVVIGKHAIIAAQVGIAGSTKIGDFVKIGGQAGISGHLNIGKNVTIAAKSGVTKNLFDNSIVAGFPAIDIKKWKLNILKLNKIK